jgi:aspartyl-tRNA(Asn)/glutamyl-tRNA(Gln) amidotransferase subunit A
VLRSGFQDRYYIRAQKIRTAIRKGFDAAFDQVDAVCMPVFPTQAFPHGSEEMDPFQQKLADKFTSAANLAGIPGLAFPTGVANGLPMGMQLLAPAFCEERLFRVAEKHEKQFPPAVPEGYTLEWS